MARNRIVRRSGGFGRGGSGRLTEWFGDPFQTVEGSLPANSFVVVSALLAAGLAKRPFTITRTIGMISILSDQNVAVEVPFGAVGGIVVSEKAVATGATAIPDPVTQVNSDLWFMYQSFAAEGSASTNVGRPIEHFPFDSRAQRKVEDGDDFVFVISNASAADGLQYIFNVRTLVKLS